MGAVIVVGLGACAVAFALAQALRLARFLEPVDAAWRLRRHARLVDDLIASVSTPAARRATFQPRACLNDRVVNAFWQLQRCSADAMCTRAMLDHVADQWLHQRTLSRSIFIGTGLLFPLLAAGVGASRLPEGASVVGDWPLVLVLGTAALGYFLLFCVLAVQVVTAAARADRWIITEVDLLSRAAELIERHENADRIREVLSAYTSQPASPSEADRAERKAA